MTKPALRAVLGTPGAFPIVIEIVPSRRTTLDQIGRAHV